MATPDLKIGVTPSPERRGMQDLFLSLHLIGGNLCMAILLVTFLLWRKGGPRRNLIIISFCFTLMLSSNCFSLLLYKWIPSRTAHHSIEEVSGFFCTVQASLIAASQSMTSVSTLSVIINLWLAVHCPRHMTSHRPKRIIYIILLLAPYVVFVSSFVTIYLTATYTQALTSTSSTLPTAGCLYCIIITAGPLIDRGSPTGTESIFLAMWSAYIFCIAIATIGLVLELHILLRLLPNNTETDDEMKGMKNSFYRISLFSGFRFLAFILFILSFNNPGNFVDEFAANAPRNVGVNEASDMIQASIPLVAFLILFTRADVLSFWRLRKQTYSTEGIHDFIIEPTVGEVIEIAAPLRDNQKEQRRCTPSQRKEIISWDVAVGLESVDDFVDELNDIDAEALRLDTCKCQAEKNFGPVIIIGNPSSGQSSICSDDLNDR